MVKFPTQNKLLYTTGPISNDLWYQPTSGGVAGHVNLPKDLSLLNRRGYASTTRKGVPLIYRCRVDLWLQDEDAQGLPVAGSGTGQGTLLDSDYQITLKMDGAQNNWVMKNAAVKWHRARAAMWKRAGVKKSQLGAYAHEIRYCYDGANDTWLIPIDGDGGAFTGGTWDYTEINNGIDEDGFQLRLVGDGIDEDSATTPSVLTIGPSYLQSRRSLDPDTNDGADSTPSTHSLLNATLFGMSDDGTNDPTDDIVENARDQGDNLPYQVYDGATTAHDITEPVELGRIVNSVGSGAHGSMIVDIPFGIANARLTVYDQADTNVTPSCLFGVQVLKIFEMQG